jgi:hypothetical protein
VKRAFRIAPSESGASLSRNRWAETPGAGQGNLATYNTVTTIPDLLIPCTLGWLLLRLFQVETDNANEPAPLQRL